LKAVGDLLLGVSLAAFGMIVLVGTASIKAPVFEEFGAAPVPRYSAIMLIALSAVLAVRSVPTLLREGGLFSIAFDPAAWGRTGGVVAVMAAYAAAIEYLDAGFVAATVPTLFVLFLVLGGRQLRFVAIAAALSVIVSVILFLVFTRLFQIDLP
jgi:Tripartite tricarboxylate transporter TctB family